MKRRSRILAALTAGVMAAGAMCFGFAQWSTSLALQGTVSASGKWDVGISKAEVTSFSTGAAVDADPVTVGAYRKCRGVSGEAGDPGYGQLVCSAD